MTNTNKYCAILTIALAFLIGTNSYSQGSWNIGYVEIDSLNSDYLNAKIKLDFKSNRVTIRRSEKVSIRHFVVPEDTAYLLINKNKITLIEKRAIYPDHGSFDDQFLEIENHDKNISERIYDTEILRLEEKRIKVRITIKSFSIQREKISKEFKSEYLEFWIDRNKLDGVMIEK